jgi:hypothetical protein
MHHAPTLHRPATGSPYSTATLRKSRAEKLPGWAGTACPMRYVIAAAREVSRWRRFAYTDGLRRVHDGCAERHLQNRPNLRRGPSSDTYISSKAANLALNNVRPRVIALACFAELAERLRFTMRIWAQQLSVSTRRALLLLQSAATMIHPKRGRVQDAILNEHAARAVSHKDSSSLRRKVARHCSPFVTRSWWAKWRINTCRDPKADSAVLMGYFSVCSP